EVQAVGRAISLGPRGAPRGAREDFVAGVRVRGGSGLGHLPLISKFADASAPALTSTSCAVPLPTDSCPTLTLYLPGGTFLIVNLPASSVMPKYGLSRAMTQALIQGCTSHETLMVSAAVTL